MERPESNHRQPGHVWHGTVDADGHILIPDELRRELQLEPGTPVVWRRKGAGLSLLRYEQLVRETQAIYKAVSPAEDVWSDTLLAERRAAAARDNVEGKRTPGEQ